MDVRRRDHMARRRVIVHAEQRTVGVRRRLSEHDAFTRYRVRYELVWLRHQYLQRACQSLRPRRLLQNAMRQGVRLRIYGPIRRGILEEQGEVGRRRPGSRLPSDHGTASRSRGSPTPIWATERNSSGN
jgi:hypothetical protein